MKFTIEEIETALAKNKVDDKTVVKVLKELEEVAEEEKAHAVTLPKAKNEFVVILNVGGDAPTLINKEFTAYVIQQKVGEDAGQILSKIREATQEFKQARKRNKSVINTLGEALRVVKRIFFKSRQLNVKTKDPVRVLISDNSL